MKKTDIIFWSIFIFIILFYIFFGNDAYKEKYELRDKVFEKNTSVLKDTIDTTK